MTRRPSKPNKQLAASQPEDALRQTGGKMVDGQSNQTGRRGVSPRTTNARMTVHQKLSTMPAWPILMDAMTAALYLEISDSSFLALARRRGLQPVDLGLGVTRWRREDLDQLVAALPPRYPGEPAGAGVLNFDAALERAARRAKARVRSVQS